uniref:Uncharacterized protein n=1 Tax=Geospiza parvula TaxID=87175 RepID=A0A8C3QC35_GEOPR
MGEKKTSARVPEGGPRRVLDAPARQRRLHRQLEALENDNFGDDPQAGLPRPGKRLPNFSDTAETGKKKKKTRGDHFKLRFRKNFQALLEEQNLSAAEGPNYVSAGLPVPAAPAPLLRRLRLPLGLHLRHLRGQVLLHALPGHPPGHQVPEVDGVTPPPIWLMWPRPQHGCPDAAPKWPP